MRRAPVLIVGGGPAGSAAATLLARGGASPELIDRSAEPRDVVCGGFLGWDAIAALGRVGLDPHALGARPIRRVQPRIVHLLVLADALLQQDHQGCAARSK